MGKGRTKQQTIEELQTRLQELEDTLEAIRGGAVDAIITSGPAGDRVFTLEGADHAYHMMVESMNEGAVTLLPEGTILYGNRRFAQMTGSAPSGVVGRRFHEFVFASDHPTLNTILNKEGRDCPNTEIRLINDPGADVPVQISASPIELSGVHALTLVITDLSSQKRYEQIVVAENLSRRILEQAQEAIAVCIDGCIVRANRALYEICGCIPLMQPFDQILSLRMSESETFSVAIPESGKSIQRQEVRYQRPDGKIFDLILTAGPLVGQENKVLGTLISLMDITERKRAEDAIRESKARLTEVLDSITDGYYVLDHEWRFAELNPVAERHFGYPAEELMGRNIWELTRIPPDAPVYQQFHRAARKNLPVHFEVQSRINPGTWSELHVYPHERRLDVYFRDITERIQAEEDLRRSEARFRLLSATAGQLLATDDPQGLINNLCRDVMEFLDCQAFFNFMVDERAGRLRLNACAGIPEAEVRKLEWLDYGVAVCGCAARDQARIIAEDIFHTPDVRTELVKSYGIQAYCCHPLKAQNRLIGTLSFGTKTRTRFTPEEVELMRIVADQVSVAMQRVQSQQDVRASEEALRLANEHLEQRVRDRTMDLLNLTEQLEKGRDDLRKLASELVMAEEKERKRIAVTLHDEVAQTLAAAKMRLDLLKTLQGSAESRQVVEEAGELLVQSIRETRSLMNNISSPVLYDLGLAAAVQNLAEQASAIYGLTVSHSVSGEFGNLEQELAVMIYQAVRELLQNVAKHSQARNVSIRVIAEETGIQAVVSDDGQGFDVCDIGSPGHESGFGLFSIRERVKSFNGDLLIESTPGKGTEVTIELPTVLREEKETSSEAN